MSMNQPGAVFVHVVPPFVVRQMPSDAATSRICGLVGSISKRAINFWATTFMLSPVGDQEAPPSFDFNTPMLLVLDGITNAVSASPVAMYMMSGSVGWITMSLIPNTGRSSVVVVHDAPPSTVFQRPPAGVPAQNVVAIVGWKPMQFTRPMPPKPANMNVDGPTSVQFAAAFAEGPRRTG